MQYLNSNVNVANVANAANVANVANASNVGELSWFKFLYKNKTQDDYASDLGWTVVMIFAFCCANAYLKIRSNAHVIRTNWVTYRCNPAYMPFAGMVMKPNDTFNEKVKFSNENFEYCMQTELKSISGMFMEPIYYSQSVIMSILHGIIDVLNDMRGLINNIRNALSSIMEDIMGRVLNVMQPVVGLLLNARDMTGKIQGIMAASLYTLIGVYDTIQSGLKSVFEVIVIILIAMGAAIIAVWIAVAIAAAFGPFGIPAVIAMTAAGVALTAVYVGIAIPMGIIAHFLAETMHIHGLSLVPSPPSR
jgi:hypothetical protein